MLLTYNKILQPFKLFLVKNIRQKISKRKKIFLRNPLVLEKKILENEKKNLISYSCFNFNLEFKLFHQV